MWFTKRSGMGMLEVLALLFLMSCLSLLVLGGDYEFDGRHYELINDYLLKQSEAIAFREERDVDGITFFYPSGVVNRGHTYNFPKHRVICHLGSGYITYD